MNYVPTKFIVVENWFKDDWTRLKEDEVTKEMRRIFKEYIKLYNFAAELSNESLDEWNKSYKGDYSLEYEKFIARSQNEVFAKVRKLNKSIKIRALVIPEDDVSVICGVTMIDGKRYICAVSLKAVYD